MCFLKHLRLDNTKPFPAYKEYSIAKEELEDFSRDQTQVQFFTPVLPSICIPRRICPYIYHSFFANQLQSILQLIAINNCSIQSLEKKIIHENPEIEKADIKITGNDGKQYESKESFHHLFSPNKNLDACYLNGSMQQEKHKICKDEVIQKLFSDLGYGFEEKCFKFKISLDENFPSQLYKNRKFKLNFKLVPHTARSSKLVPNSKKKINQGNLLNICIAIFDKNGNWTHENTVGEPIMNGQKQCQLYQGKGGFSRLLINQISSNMPKEKLNFAIYVIPGADSTLNKEVPVGRNDENPPNFIDWKSIKPLIIRNATILSKKSKRNKEDAE